MATANTITPKPIYAPKGCNCPIMAHVTEAERDDLKRIAELEMRTLSATARMLMLRGIAEYDQDTLNAE
ncbi:hypothetical protein LPL18_011555 [Halomonas sp. CUBES01]|uniref:Uncharacterized protein n=1 Tax=Vreelandella subterranea TaxID=416874 RepID=A0A1H9WG87_9GAMM|nr:MULTISPECIES: hypothetical protein [Halomonas]MCZ0930320.1 hypothetical protein [Halomonas janggokensis]MEC4767959.1 hypothetical protein [Halomonas sp. CUBES01]SES32821.1 hypothetical protein SAMN04487958_11497 [Halomonas subterranea]